MNRIKELRIAKGLTQTQLSIVLSVQRSALSKYENGILSLTDNTVILLADFFDVTTDYILGRTNSPNLPVTDKIEIRKLPDIPVPPEAEKAATGEGDGLTGAQRELIERIKGMDDPADVRALLAAADALAARKDDSGDG